MVLFSNGFEEGDFSAWTGQVLTAGRTCEVEHNNPHHGTHNERTVTTNAGDEAYEYKTVASSAIAYLRFYVKFNSLNLSENKDVALGQLTSGSFQYAATAGLHMSSGVVLWCLLTMEAGGYQRFDGTHTPVVDTWYCVEIKRDVTNDLQELWIDNVSEASGNRVITTNSSQVNIGVSYNEAAVSNTIYFDCVYADTSYIGLEASGPTVRKSSSVVAAMSFVNTRMII